MTERQRKAIGSYLGSSNISKGKDEVMSRKESQLQQEHFGKWWELRPEGVARIKGASEGFMVMVGKQGSSDCFRTISSVIASSTAAYRFGSHVNEFVIFKKIIKAILHDHNIF